jgi:IstB-like ATP binding protein
VGKRPSKDGKRDDSETPTSVVLCNLRIVPECVCSSGDAHPSVITVDILISDRQIVEVVELVGYYWMVDRMAYGDWGSIFGDSIIATAILDRLLHHSTTINIRGESYRLKDRRKAGLVPRGQDGAEAAARSLASDSVPPKTRQKTALGCTPSEAKEAHR